MTTSKTRVLSLTLVSLLVALTFVQVQELRANPLNVPPAPPEKPRSDLVLANAAGMSIGTLWPFKGPSPEKNHLSGYVEPGQVLESTSPDRREAIPTSKVYGNIWEAVKAEISEGRIRSALRILNQDKLSKALKPYEYDLIRSRIAAAFYYEGALNEAVHLAKASANRSGVKVPFAAWIAGLSLWRSGDIDDALPYFELVSSSPHADGWTRAAGAYWASRAATYTKSPALAIRYLREASKHKYTFYGIVAARALGITPSYDWSKPKFGAVERKLILSHPDARRVFDLVERGRYSQADRLLRSINVLPHGKMGQAIYAYALNEDLAGTSLHYASTIRESKNQISDAGLYPMLAWLPQQGQVNDLSLMHAIIRQESRFKTGAESNQGALGLMQLMPQTAKFINASATSSDAHILNPKNNVALGQKYISQLLNMPVVSQDLFSMAIAYNAGPGNLLKWKRELADLNDPLLFIESIPAGETRAFVERVMANYWIYNVRFDKSNRTLDLVASGNKPVYRPMLQAFSSFSFAPKNAR